MPRGMPSNMRPMRKGERRVGRAKGTPNKMTREIKEALINAAEMSKHSSSKTLEGYALYLADNKPEVFASLLGRLIPVQANVKHVGSVGATNITINMPLGEMINNFERRIKAACETIDVAAPPLVIEHDPVDA